MPAYIEWLRSKIGTRKVPLVFACAIVRDDTGRVLWQQRGDFGWWGLLGGVVELDESLTECLVREVREEAGLLVEPQRLVGIYSSPDFDVTYPNGDEVQQITFTFACRVTGGSLESDGSETLALAWHTPPDLPQTSPWYRAMITDLCLELPQPRYTHGSAGGRQFALPLYRYLRKFIGKAAYVAAGSAAVVLDPAGRVLLQRRSDNGEWSLPGGALELGERIDHTVVQEVYEETGLRVAVERISGVYSDERFFITYPNGDQMKVVVAVFVCSVTGGKLQADGEESLEVKFFPPAEMPAMQDKIEEIIRDALDGRGHPVIS